MTTGGVTRRYDLAGHILEIHAPGDDLARSLDDMIGPLVTDASGEPAFRIFMVVGTPQPAPQGSRLVYEGPLLEEGDCVYSECGAVLHLAFPGILSLSVDEVARSATLTAAPGHVRRIRQSLGMMALAAAVDATGQQVLHAAGLVLPDSERTVLIHAPSGTGKTTTALALAGAGFRLCADDVMVLRFGDEGVSAWGFPRGVKVHRKTAAMLPEVAKLMGPKWDAYDEQFVELPDLAPAVTVTNTQPRPVSALIHLVREGKERATIRPMARADALATLAFDNVRIGQTGLLASQQRRFAALGRLAAAVATYEISVGSDPVEVAALIRDIG